MHSTVSSAPQQTRRPGPLFNWLAVITLIYLILVAVGAVSHGFKGFSGGAEGAAQIFAFANNPFVTLLLGITVGGTMAADKFLTMEVFWIMLLGAVAFVFDTVGGVLFAKLLNILRSDKINPMIGACGISAFPMSGRVIAKMALKEDPTNFIIQHAIGVNVAGQIASVVAGGLVLALIPALAK